MNSHYILMGTSKLHRSVSLASTVVLLAFDVRRPKRVATIQVARRPSDHSWLGVPTHVSASSADRPTRVDLSGTGLKHRVDRVGAPPRYLYRT